MGRPAASTKDASMTAPKRSLGARQRKALIEQIESACQVQGVTMDISICPSDSQATAYFGHAKRGGIEIWLSWIESTIPGNGARAMQTLVELADEHDFVIRACVDDDGSGKLTSYYERFGFYRDPAGGDIVERVPFPSQEEAIHQWVERSLVTRDGLVGGEPLVVFHGTKERFPLSGMEASARGSFGRGCYFAGDELQARNYMSEPDEGVVLKAVLRMRRPYRHSIREPQQIDTWGEGLVLDIFEPAKAQEIIDAALKSEEPGFDGVIAERLLEMGHDGIIATYQDGTQEFVAFAPYQVREVMLPARELRAEHEALEPGAERERLRA